MRLVKCVSYVFLIILAFLATHVISKDESSAENSVLLYEKGVEAYLDNKFKDCVKYFEKALKKYHLYSKELQNCRIKCKQDAEYSEPLYPIDVEHLLFYEKAIRTTLCIVKCKNESHQSLFGTFNINPQTEKLFLTQKPYEYLHLCYFQMKQMQKAASAAYTYLVTHPNDKIIISSLKQYSLMNEVNMNEIVNYEAKDYVYLYVHGADAYERKDWKGVKENMEESLASYYQADEECRAQCEGPFDPGWYPDFIPSISNHFTYCLQCKQECKKKLNSLNGEIHDDLLPSHYHYLQYAYFKLGKLKAACKAVASYLLFYSDDETMLSNMKYYRSLPKVQDDFFTPNHESIRYVQRETYENRLLKFINTQFNFTNQVTQELHLKPKFRIIRTEKELQGPNRFVLDGFLTNKQCRNLVDIAKMFAIQGDGYEGKKSPHTIMEKFEGVTLTRATLLVYIGLLEKKYFELYLKLTENVKEIIMEYFNITQELHFSYTHLVCRSALPDSPKNRTDFSHPIHADNCNIKTDGQCEKSPPAYTWRDYSAILYLNSDFDGGEFIFSEDLAGEKIQSMVTPKCGRMIVFSSGSENLHGVRSVKRGSRCAIGIWFTHDSNHVETNRILAYQLLEKNFSFNPND